MPFWTYNQNNSGGSFDYNLKAGISHLVIIEADSAEEADDRARDIGLYFWDYATTTMDEYGDCPCCGDRWNTAYGTGDPEPMYYDAPITKMDEPGYFGKGLMGMKWIDGYEAFVHYKDGRIVGHGLGDRRKKKRLGVDTQ